MLVGAHVSPAGGPARAVDRGVERGAEAIQFFNQSPRAWRAREYTDEEAAEFREDARGLERQAALIHAVYLINCASRDRTIRAQVADRADHRAALGRRDLGASGVVLHAGSALAGRRRARRSPARAKVIREALAESEDCPLQLENTAGAGGTLGRSFSELAALIEAAGGDERLGICLDSCHLLRLGLRHPRPPRACAAVIDECVEVVGTSGCARCTSTTRRTALGSNGTATRPLGEGELGAKGCVSFLSEPRFDGLPAIFEGPGVEGKAPTKADVDAMKRLRKRGLSARRR